MGSSQPVPVVAPELRHLQGFVTEPFNPFAQSVERGLADEREQARRRLLSTAQRAGNFASSDARDLERRLEEAFMQQLGQFRFGQVESAQNRALNLLGGLGQPRFAPSGAAQVVGGLGGLLGPLAQAGGVAFKNPLLTIGK